MIVDSNVTNSAYWGNNQYQRRSYIEAQNKTSVENCITLYTYYIGVLSLCDLL